MNVLPPSILYYGQDLPIPQPIPLRAGPLTMLYQDGELRYVRWGKQEVLRRIYVAVRDRNWETIEAHISVQDQSIHSDSFLVQFRAHHIQNEIDFVWDGVISGDAEGTIRFSMNGEALSTFWRNRIGFCVLHPMSCSGTSCMVEHTDGTVTHGSFPVDIAPYQPFLNMQAIKHVVETGLQAEIRFSGDAFEMEDQRNWTDASYKTYCTPLNLPFPVKIRAGTKVQQSVELRLIGDARLPLKMPQGLALEPVQIEIGSKVVGRLPRLGLCVASHDQPLSSMEIERLRSLHLSHLRVDIDFRQPDWETRFRQSVSQYEEVAVPIEVALHLTSKAEQELLELRRTLNELKPPIETWLLFDENGNSASPGLIALAHQYLGDYSAEILFAGGTDAFFAQLNRNRPSLDGLDVITYSLNPQVHAFDQASLIENLPAQMSTLTSARRFSGGRRLAVSPVTLRMSFNPAATDPNSSRPSDRLPSQVDPRQMSLFGAVWTLGSIKYLAEGGAYRVTYYETTGWLGIMETEAGSPLPSQFPSLPGSVFPMYHIFADLGQWANAEVLETSSTDPLTAVGMAISNEQAWCVFVANFSAHQQTVELLGLQGNLHVKMLDEFTAQEAMTKPDVYRARPVQILETSENRCSIELAPYAVANIFIEKSKGD